MVVDYLAACSLRPFWFWLPTKRQPVPSMADLPARAAYVMGQPDTLQFRRRCLVRWYWSPPGAKTLPFPTFTASSEWLDDYQRCDVEYGEIPRYEQTPTSGEVWPPIEGVSNDPGNPPPGVTGQHWCGTPEDFLSPGVYGERALRRTVWGVPFCCNVALADIYVMVSELLPQGAAVMAGAVSDMARMAYAMADASVPNGSTILANSPVPDALTVMSAFGNPIYTYVMADDSLPNATIVLAAVELAQGAAVMAGELLPDGACLLVSELSGEGAIVLGNSPVPDGQTVQASVDVPHGKVDFLGTGPFTWTVPAGVYFVIAEAWGEGGRSSWSAGGGGGGGGGGAYARSNLVPVIPGTVTRLFNGDDGTQVASWWNGTGANAEPAVASDGVLALAGHGAASDLGGAAGSDVGCIGDVAFSGGAGGDGFVDLVSAGGGGGGGSGGSMGAGSDGADGLAITGGAGGPGGASGGSSGGDGGDNGNPGIYGTQPGGGGGGAGLGVIFGTGEGEGLIRLTW